MSAALLYRPGRRWQVWVAFAGAILIHVAAVAVAGMRRPTLPPAVTICTGFHDVVIEDISEPRVSEPIETPPPDPAPSIVESAMPEENPTPPPIRRETARPPQRLIRAASGRPGGATRARAARVLAISAPPPQYPYEARLRRVTGSGIAMLTVNATGHVVRVTMLRSTGSAVLDGATISGLRRWRFTPGTVSKLQMPVTYRLAGASY